jgi:hypothetical protein
MTLAGSDAPDAASLAESLWLISSVIAARRSDRATSTERLDPATQFADLLAHDLPQTHPAQTALATRAGVLA